MGVYKDALYSDPAIADRLTGAFRLTPLASGFIVAHVQLVRGAEADSGFEVRLAAAMGIPAHAGHVIASPYEAFPYGMTLDYERKFAYYVPGKCRSPRREPRRSERQLHPETDAEGASVLGNRVLQVLVGGRDRVVETEQIAHGPDEFERSSERLDHRQVCGCRSAELVAGQRLPAADPEDFDAPAMNRARRGERSRDP